MVIDTSNLTDEQISKLSEFVHAMEKENKVTKWWIIAKYTPFSGMADFEKYGPCYYVEPQNDSYGKNNPPLKSGFDSAEDVLGQKICVSVRILLKQTVQRKLPVNQTVNSCR